MRLSCPQLNWALASSCVSKFKHGDNCGKWLVLLITGILLWYSQPPDVAAQQPTTGWSSSTLISARGQLVIEPQVVSDPAGYLHVFFRDDIERSGGQGVIYYRRYDGEKNSWSPPSDIIAMKDGSSVSALSAALDGRGEIHLIWRASQNAVWYAHAPVGSAASARAWSQPRLIGGAASALSIVVGGDDSLNVVYGGRDALHDVYYVRSDNGGTTWSQEAKVSQTESERTLATYPQLAIDRRGRLHMVWTEMPLPVKGYMSTAIWYSQSLDNGRTWSSAQPIDQFDITRYQDNYGPQFASLGIVGMDEIHVVWNGAPRGQRHHRRSTNGGISWSKDEPILGQDFRGETSFSPMVTDAKGRIHLVSAGFNTQGDVLLYSYWDGQKWVSPIRVNSQGPGGEQPALVLLNGNQLALAWWSGSSGIYFVSRTVDTAFVAPKPWPTITSTPAGYPTPTPSLVRLATPRPSSHPSSQEPGSFGNELPNLPIIIGILPAGIMLVCVVLVRALRWRG